MTISLAVKGTACLLQGVALYSTVQDVRGNYSSKIKPEGVDLDQIKQLQQYASESATTLFNKTKSFSVHLEKTDSQWATCAVGTNFGPASIAIDAITVANSEPLARFWLSYSVAVICSNVVLKVQSISLIVFIATAILLSPTLPVASYAIAYGLGSLIGHAFDRKLHLSAFEKAVAHSSNEQLTQAKAYLKLQQQSGKSEISYLDAKLALLNAKITENNIRTND